MNKDKMIEAITTAILGKTAPKAAAAVLDLCGPEKLKFNAKGAARFQGCVYVVLESEFDDGAGEIWYILIDSKTAGKLGQFSTEESAQAAAQAHADAAHWANTGMGDLMVGGE
jgi:hypothetical protein